MDALIDLLRRIFVTPPQVPDLKPPFMIRQAPGFLERVEDVCKLFYFEGFKDGFFAGIIGSFVLVILMITARKKE